MRRAKVFKKARRAKLSVNRLPELAALLVNGIICFQKENEVERNSVESKVSTCHTDMVVVNIYMIFGFEKMHSCRNIFITFIGLWINFLILTKNTVFVFNCLTPCC